MNHFIKFLLVAVAIVTAVPSFAVSQQEMEQARAMAAKHYLRYANNGSDYLDKLNPSSVAELTKSLKAKEVENMKSFNAVAVPKDYASWDKAKLVEYWSNTFFKSSGLKEDGKKCLGILAKNLNKIEVKPTQDTAPGRDAILGVPGDKPGDKSEEKPEENSAVQNETPTPSSEDASVAEAAAVQEAAAVEEVMTEEERPRKSTGTGWYIAILVILIGVVVWLVMYAQKSMKESGQIVADHKDAEKEVRDAKRSAKEEINKMRDQYAASIAAKNMEITQLRERCDALEEELEKAKSNHAKSAEGRDAILGVPRDNARDNATDKVKDKADSPRPTRPATALPPVVFLGYVNQRGLFVKASRSLNADSSVYRMDIPDGMHGTFRVVSDPSILDRLLSDPAQWLEGGCDIENPEDADIATEIVTMTEGEALFADNTCRVVRKARIKFI